MSVQKQLESSPDNTKDFHGDQIKDIHTWIEQILPRIQVIDKYDDSNTPLELFDSEIHNNAENGLGQKINKISSDNDEEDLLFLINVAEQCRRPDDMLMLVGEYLKKCISLTLEIKDNIEKQQQGLKVQEKFFVTDDILNYIGTAAKMLIENPRQELRISIALARNPSFNKDDGSSDAQLDVLKKNIQETQSFIARKCFKIYRFIDFAHDRREIVPTKYQSQQPSKQVINGLMFKMKADQLRFIYETLSGENGLLNDKRNKQEDSQFFSKVFQERENLEISQQDQDVQCYLCRQASNQQQFYFQCKNMMDFMRHEVIHEYEKVKLQFFDRRQEQVKQNPNDAINEVDRQFNFHYVFLSAVLNQAVFRVESKLDMIKYEISGITNIKKEDDEIIKQEGKKERSKNDLMKLKKQELNEVIEDVNQWKDLIDSQLYISQLSNEDQDIAWAIYHLIERALEQWKQMKEE